MLSTLLFLGMAMTAPQLGETYVHEYFAYSPIGATLAGYHKDGVDRKLDQLSDSARQGRAKALHRMEHQIALLDLPKLGAQDRADVRLLQQSIALELIELEHAKEFSRRPDLPIGALGNVFLNMGIRAYAPAAQRAADVAARLKEVPRYLEQARKSLTHSVDIFRDAAARDGQGLIEFLRDDLVAAFDAGAPRETVKQAVAATLGSIESYLTFVKGPMGKMPRADFRYGEALYRERFGPYLQTDWSPEEVAKRARERLGKVRAEMVKLSETLTPRKAGQSDADLVRAALELVARDHPKPSELLEISRQDVARERAFIETRQLLTLPPSENLKIILTPAFMRSQYGVAGYDGPPPLTPKLGGFFYVTPFPKEWPRDRVESQLREYNRYKLELLAIHEAMPGHFVQLEWGNRVEPEARRVIRWLLSSTAYVEGWAVFAEDLMLREGYGKDPRMRLTYLKEWLRIVGNALLDMGLHMHQMTDEKAMELMVTDTFQEQAEAELKLRRAKLSVTQLCSYFVGVEEWSSIWDAARKAGGAKWDGRAFLDQALRLGGVALPSLREIVLEGNKKVAH